MKINLVPIVLKSYQESNLGYCMHMRVIVVVCLREAKCVGVNYINQAIKNVYFQFGSWILIRWQIISPIKKEDATPLKWSALNDN